MTTHRVMLAIIGMSLFTVCGQWPDQTAAQVNVDVGGVVRVRVGERPPPQAIEVLTRGPLHEAFAQPVVLDEGTALVIDRQPPQPIDEVVPDEMPEGSNVAWIPGYWNWDSDRNDFIWVSGCWRAVPPNTSWVPGYWAQVGGGYQWVAGFWTKADAEELEYLPTPPASLEEGPQGTGAPDSVWIPGCWVRQTGRYAWRPGFWEQARTNWVWEPAHYVYSPRGCVYVEGYWDYPLDRRGVAFSPVYCPPRLYGQPNFRYSPDIALNLAALTASLFCSPQRHQYYFGDYYGNEYTRAGYYPWYEARERHGWYDPTFTHRQWQHRDDRRWYDNERAEYQHRLEDKSLRPARTYEAMRAQVARLPANERPQVQMAQPLNQVVAGGTTPFKFATVDAKTREAAAARARDVHAYRDKRAQWESPTAGVTPREGTVPRARETAPPKSPVTTPPRETVTPREPVAPPPKVVTPKEPLKEVAPSEKATTPDRRVVGEPAAGRDIQGQKVKIPKRSISAGTNKDLTPPPTPKQPNVDTQAKPRQPKGAADQPKGAADRTSEGPDKNKTEPK